VEEFKTPIDLLDLPGNCLFVGTTLYAKTRLRVKMDSKIMIFPSVFSLPTVKVSSENALSIGRTASTVAGDGVNLMID